MNDIHKLNNREKQNMADSMSTREPVIAQAMITSSNPHEGRYQAVVTATFDTGTVENVLSYYDDELTFTTTDFIGLTRKGVNELFFAKDQSYLQTP